MKGLGGPAALAALVLALGAASARADEPVTIRLSWTTNLGQLASVLFNKPEILKHYGKSYTVQPIYYKGSGPQITALAAGELEIAEYAPAALALSVENAHIDDVRVIGDATRDGHADYNSRKFMVRADSPIRTVDDLKGKVLATNSFAGAMDIAMRDLLKRHGMVEKRDFQELELDFPNQYPALVAGKIDLASISLPFSIAAEATGKVRTLFTMKDAIGESDMTIMAARASFVAAHRAALVDFFEDAQRALCWFYDPANRDAVLDIMAEATKRPPSFFAGWIFTKRDDWRDMELKPDLKLVQEDIDRQVQLGIIPAGIDVAKHADLSLVAEAAKRPR